MDQSGLHLDEAITKARVLVDEGCHGQALVMLEALVEKGLQTASLYEASASAALAAILADLPQDAWPRDRRGKLYRWLILQPQHQDQPPAFHSQIVSHPTTDHEHLFKKVGLEISALLQAMWDEHFENRNALTMTLILRDHLGSWGAQNTISERHVNLLPKFTRADMALPYNGIFNKDIFKRNVDDIDSVLKHTPAAELAHRFTPSQLIYLHWITSGSSIPADITTKLFHALRPHTANDSTESRSTEDIAAVRSLALRNAMGTGDSVYVEELGGTLHELVMQRAKTQPTLSDPTAADKIKDRMAAKPWQAVYAAMQFAERSMPALHLGRRRPRVAVCVSGQLRGYKQAFPSWASGLLRNIDYQLVVHSWNRIGRSGAEPFRAYLPFTGTAFCNAYREHAHNAGMQEMTGRYPLLFSTLQKGGEVNLEQLKGFYCTDHVILERDDEQQFADWSNSRKMHYKIHAASELMVGLEEDFDLVLRIRPDKELGLAAFSWRSLLAAARLSPTIFADIGLGYQYGDLLIGDQVAIGAPSAMRTYADTYQLLPQLASQQLFRCKDEFHGHTSLALTCWHAGIDVRRLPVKMGKLLDVEQMSIAETTACLEQDASGRMDHMDRVLLQAIRADAISP